jgi:hypothetical protein
MKYLILLFVTLLVVWFSLMFYQGYNRPTKTGADFWQDGYNQGFANGYRMGVHSNITKRFNEVIENETGESK